MIPIVIIIESKDHARRLESQVMMLPAEGTNIRVGEHSYRVMRIQHCFEDDGTPLPVEVVVWRSKKGR